MSEEKKPTMVSTKDVSTGGGTAKTIQPGNQKITILSAELEDLPESYKKPGAVNLKFRVEGPDMGPEFEGFKIDKDDESKGLYKGQVGTVKATEWPFADGIIKKTNRKISRDNEILRWLKNFCINTSCLEWFDAQDGKYPTALDIVKAFCAEKPFAGKTYDSCVGGREYDGGKGYTNYDLFFPNFTKDNTPITLFGAESKQTLHTFDASKHITRKEKTNVQEFEGNNGGGNGGSEAANTATNDFEL